MATSSPCSAAQLALVLLALHLRREPRRGFPSVFVLVRPRPASPCSFGLRQAAVLRRRGRGRGDRRCGRRRGPQVRSPADPLARLDRRAAAAARGRCTASHCGPVSDVREQRRLQARQLGREDDQRDRDQRDRQRLQDRRREPAGRGRGGWSSALKTVPRPMTTNVIVSDALGCVGARVVRARATSGTNAADEQDARRRATHERDRRAVGDRQLRVARRPVHDVRVAGVDARSRRRRRRSTKKSRYSTISGVSATPSLMSNASRRRTASPAPAAGSSGSGRRRRPCRRPGGRSRRRARACRSCRR